MSCSRCGSYAEGDLCRQCETELKFADLANEVATGDPWDDDTEGDDD
jgi:hypothetical protein